MFGSPLDGVESPYISPWFGTFGSNYKLVSLEERDVYAADRYGLRQMNGENRLFRENSDILHGEYRTNERFTGEKLVKWVGMRE